MWVLYGDMTTKQFLQQVLSAQKVKLLDAADFFGRGWKKVPYLNHQFGKLPINKAFKVAEAVDMDFREMVHKFTKLKKA